MKKDKSVLKNVKDTPDLYEWECPECSQVGNYIDIRYFDQGVDFCPDCHTEIICTDNQALQK